ncbi:MAG: hypothetical protein DRJ52_07950 [Thermoprotei archaeon]|nr:MAG: hypothetical protein DRJ52_07950 [Thermoprotei archaeon]RLE99240.1 MAG: hypothetical protein DRJ63_05965 [Thermoprotei archaeon]HDI75196.1 hypothetical protein [Thermoprotei archaeon]
MEILSNLTKRDIKAFLYIAKNEPVSTKKLLKVLKSNDTTPIYRLKEQGLIKICNTPLQKPYTLLILTKKGRVLASLLLRTFS